MKQLAIFPCGVENCGVSKCFGSCPNNKEIARVISPEQFNKVMGQWKFHRLSKVSPWDYFLEHIQE